MGIEYYKYVWKNYKKQGGHKLVMLALADYANDETGECWPSIATLAEMVCVSDRQVQKILADLKQSGDIDVKVAHGRTNTNTYRIIKKGEPQDTFNEGKDELHDTFSEEKKVNYSTEKVNSSAEKVNYSTQKGELQFTRSIIEPLIEPIRDSFADAKAPPEKIPKEPTAQQQYFAKVCDIVGWDYRTITKEQKGQVAQTIGVLQEAQYTYEDLTRFGKEVWANDWRWMKKKQRPTLTELRAEIGKLKKSDTFEHEAVTNKVSGKAEFSLGGLFQ
jgi:DNA-binding transcriptional regulator YhcF (GntR family)